MILRRRPVTTKNAGKKAMDENSQEMKNVPEPQGTKGRNILRLVVSLLLIAAGLAGARFLINNKPVINKRPPVKMEPLVRTRVLQPENYTLKIPAMGNVIPAREISLETQVGGEITYLHPDFSEGGMLPQGTKIAQINPKDYELAIMQKKRALAEAEYAFRLEEGHQDVARREWELLYGEEKLSEAESGLALRKPHLEKVQVEIASARADLELAETNLERTGLAAPFNALVLNKYVDVGSQVTPQEKLADLVGTDIFWVKVPLPLERLRWIRFPAGGSSTGSTVQVFYRGDSVREGRVIRLLPDLSKEGRMARLLVAVDDPLDLQAEGGRRPVLLIGEYVRVLIEGEQLRDIYRIPRAALHNDSEVWIVDGESRLAIRPVKTVWRDEDSVIIRDGFKPGEHLVVSGLAAPVAGMPLRIEEPAAPRRESK
jgi:RND family efflux transporter MFP subunit